MSQTGEARVVECELCLVGAGIAGLNALSSAKAYLNALNHFEAGVERAHPQAADV